MCMVDCVIARWLSGWVGDCLIDERNDWLCEWVGDWLIDWWDKRVGGSAGELLNDWIDFVFFLYKVILSKVTLMRLPEWVSVQRDSRGEGLCPVLTTFCCSSLQEFLQFSLKLPYRFSFHHFGRQQIVYGSQPQGRSPYTVQVCRVPEVYQLSSVPSASAF